MIHEGHKELQDTVGHSTLHISDLLESQENIYLPITPVRQNTLDREVCVLNFNFSVDISKV